MTDISDEDLEILLSECDSEITKIQQKLSYLYRKKRELHGQLDHWNKQKELFILYKKRAEIDNLQKRWINIINNNRSETLDDPDII